MNDYCPDNYDAYRRHEAEQERQLSELPVCCYCDNPIQDEHLYEINGEAYCPDCLETYFKKRTEDFVA